jgi:NAD(P)-dependent dehydrogenase (short-subunit alcohol dehydrogenase family)
MAGQAVLATGGTGGIGEAIALGPAAMGARLAITGRDRGRAPGAAVEIRAADGQVEVFVADLSAQSEVRRLAGEVLQRLSRIDVLVNNAGGFWNTRYVTADGFERTSSLNHLAPFLTTNLTPAFGAGSGLVVIGAVYLGVGMQAGPTASAVLLYRLATYWLPGWLCWRSLQHRGYM